MAQSATTLSLAEFDRLYGNEHGWEYWFGEARRKPVPTRLHGLLQLILGQLLWMAGYIASSEVDLKITADWQPRPDVHGELEPISGPYPTKPVPVVFEILSRKDQAETKCREYTRIGIPQVFVFDPEARSIEEWEGKRLVPVADVRLGNGVTITGRTIWSELDRRLHERPEPPASKII